MTSQLCRGQFGNAFRALFATVAACLMLILSTAELSAANITWVSFHPADNMPSAGAAGAGFTEAPDKGYTDLLSANGHTVTRFLVNPPTPDVALSQAQLDQLNASDLVILGRSVNSGSFQQAVETASWNNSITAPMIVTSGFLTRANRLGYTSGDTATDILGPTRLAVARPAHPVFAGIALDANDETGAVLDLATANAVTQRGASINANALMPGGILLASITADGTPAAGQVISYFPAGTASQNAGETFASRRMLFTTGSREVDMVSGDTAGVLDLSADGQQMFLNAVNYMVAVPEPSSALLTLLSVVALGLLRSKR